MTTLAFGCRRRALLGRVFSGFMAKTSDHKVEHYERKSTMKNLLPNASFELDFGQAKHEWVKYNPGEGAADNWTDMFTPLTAPLAKNGQVPQAWPVIVASADAPDAERAAVITAAEGKPGHLTSPVVAVKGGHGYTLSVYARSGDAVAGAVPWARPNLHLCVWHQPLNWDVPPDAKSDPIAVTNQWQRYEITFVVPTWLHTAVVDLMAVANGDAKISVDAVQLEHAPQATAFETRLPTEAHITSDTYFSGMLHLHGEPLELKLNVYQHRPADNTGDLEVRIETLEGREMLTTQVAVPASHGRHSVPLSLEFPWVGDFRAKVFSAAGECIDVSTYGYMFTVHPVMQAGYGWEKPAPDGDDFQGILYSRDGEVHELPAERYRLPTCHIGEGTWNFTITHDNDIYMPAAIENPGVQSDLLCTRDGGRTWQTQKVTRPIAAVLRNGSFLSYMAPEPPHRPMPMQDGRLCLARSDDGGQTWQPLGGPGPAYEDTNPGRITELRDGSLIWPIGYRRPGFLHATFTFLSSDGGRTWSGPSPVCPTGEPSVIELASGRLLAVVRNNLIPGPGHVQAYFEDEHEDYWRLWLMQYGRADSLESAHKNVMLADSDDGGATWTNVRKGCHGLGEMHGSAVELPDGRIVLMHVHRVPWLHGGERAHVSRDGGNTWDKEIYYLSTVLTYPEYSTNCVLPPELADGKEGMILSVLGDRPAAMDLDRPQMLQAVRWRPLA